MVAPLLRRVSPIMLGLLALAGCGGGGGNPMSNPNPVPPTPTTATVRFGLNWAARTRDVNVPASALSMVAVLQRAQTNGSSITFRQDRRADPAAYSEVLSSAQVATIGAHPLSIRFYSGPSGTGSVVATAGQNVTIAADGSGISEVTVTGRIATVVAQAQTVAPGSTTQLEFAARDAAGRLLAVSPGSATWSQTSGSGSLTADGVFTAAGAETLSVQVSVDGVVSAPATITVADRSQPADPILNASFESPAYATNTWEKNDVRRNKIVTIEGWSGLNEFGLANGSNPWGKSAHSGAQFVFLQANPGENSVPAEISQTLTGLVPGNRYRITFWYAARHGDYGADYGTPVDAYVDGTQIVTRQTPPADFSWVQVTSNAFTATSSSMVFRIVAPHNLSGHSDAATLLDDFAIEPVGNP